MGMVAWVLLGLIVGIGGTSVGQLWWDSFRPNPVRVDYVDVHALEDGGYRLTVHLKVPKVTNCLRLAEHILSPKPDGLEGEYQPLAATLAGRDFTRGGEVVVDLKVHPHMVRSGDTWYYYYRSAYECTRFPGLLRVSDWQSAPIPVTFAGNSY